MRLKIESKREQVKPRALIANQKDLLMHLLLRVTKSLWRLGVADENPSLWSATESLCWGEASRPRFASDIFPCCSNPINAGTWRDLWRTAHEGLQGAAFKTSRVHPTTKSRPQQEAFWAKIGGEGDERKTVTQGGNRSVATKNPRGTFRDWTMEILRVES